MCVGFVVCFVLFCFLILCFLFLFLEEQSKFNLWKQMRDFHRKVLRSAVNREGICSWLSQSFRDTVNPEITAEGQSLFCCSSVVCH